MPGVVSELRLVCDRSKWRCSVAEVGAYEAKTRLAELLDQVARGERVTITKHGVPVAVLVPAGRAGKQVVSDAIASIKAFRKGRRIGRVAIATMVAEGRR